MHSVVQNYVVFQDGEVFRARGQIDGGELTADKNAAHVIQAAVDAQEDGGEVYLSRGTFLLNSPINLRTRILLRGSGRATRMIVDGPDFGLICEGSKETVIADLAVLGTANSVAGVVIDNSGDCHVRDVLCQGFASYGFWLRNNTFLSRLQGCTAADNGKANIYLDGLMHGGRGGDFVPNLVANCMTYGGGTGIEGKRAIVINIVGCAVFQPKGYGYYLRDTSNSVVISGCRSFQVEKDAVRVESAHELNISSNIFCWHRGNGLVLRDVSWGAINGNEVIDSGVRTHDGSYTTGIILSENTQGIQITGNTIFNWGDQVPMAYGIVEDESCRNNLIVSNNINFFTQADVVSQGQQTIVRDNLSEKDTAYQNMGKPAYPDYDYSRIEKFTQL